MGGKPLWLVVVGVILAADLVSAQTFGQVTGIVSDPSGGALVGASITATNTQNGTSSGQQANTSLKARG